MEYKGFKIYKYTTSDWYAVLLECNWLSGEDKVVYRCKSVEKAKAWIDKNCKGEKNMFKIKIYCNDGDVQYWDDGIGTYETYDKALIACYENALQEVKSLMINADRDRWFEVEEDFEITEAYENEELKNVEFFEVATIYYDHAPQDRENDCDIQIVTGYMVVEV